MATVKWQSVCSCCNRGEPSEHHKGYSTGSRTCIDNEMNEYFGLSSKL